MKQKLIVLFVLLPILVFSLNKRKWKKASDGIYYKIFTNAENNTKPVYNDYVWMHLKKYTNKKKEQFNTRVFDKEKGVEMQLKYVAKKGEITPFFLLMHKGDSAIVKIPKHLLDSNGCKKKYYTYYLNLIDFKPLSIYEYEKKELYKQQIVIDSLAIIDYLENEKLVDFIKDENGIWYKRTETAEGKPVEANKQISIHYKGKLLNKEEFDNSYDRKQTLNFMLNKKQVIEGLDKALLNLNYGDKAIIIIPSRLAYGDKEVGKIPPNSVLLFEVEVLPQKREN
ncbi:MAG TPA: FKBP-type peptidyl-prolyl cis-trans isomerase [Chitinophagales bacterium]|nr:FKBP-type peptidyl-prolyl cis-trans isomerase [Chitinophagales bacterium]